MGQFRLPVQTGSQVAEVGVEAMHKTKQPQKKSVVSGRDMDYTTAVNRVASPERRSPSRAIEVVVGNSTVEGRDSGQFGYQAAVGEESVTWEWLARESCRSLVRFVKGPIAVEHILP